MIRRRQSAESPRQPAAYSLAFGLRTICTRDFILITMINLLVMSTYYMLFVCAARQTTETYGVSLSMAAFSTGMMVIGAMSGRFASSNIISITGLKAMLILGIIGYGLCLGAFFAIDSFWLLCLLRLMTGICIGMCLTATGTFAACIVPQMHQGLGISVFSISAVLALAFGPFIGIILYGVIAFSGLVILSLGTAAVCLALAVKVSSIAGLYRRKRPVFSLQSYIDPRVVRFALVAFIMAMGYGCVQVFLPGFAAQRGLEASSSLFFILYGLAALLTRPLSGRLFDRYGDRKILPSLFLLTMLALGVIAAARSPAMLLLGGFLLGTGFGNYHSIGQAVAISRVTRSRFAQATTTFFVFFDCGIGVGPYFFGMIPPFFGYTGLFIGLVVSSFLALLLYIRIGGQQA